MNHKKKFYDNVGKFIVSSHVSHKCLIAFPSIASKYFFMCEIERVNFNVNHSRRFGMRVFPSHVNSKVKYMCVDANGISGKSNTNTSCQLKEIFENFINLPWVWHFHSLMLKITKIKENLKKIWIEGRKSWCESKHFCGFSLGGKNLYRNWIFSQLWTWKKFCAA